MSRKRLSTDPRTIAREVAGVFDAVFPQLVPAVVKHFNEWYSCSPPGECVPLEDSLIAEGTLEHAMLFELGCVAAEDMLAGAAEPDWEGCLRVALDRQRRFFDATLPSALTRADKRAAKVVARNLTAMLRGIATQGEQVVCAPAVPGFRWISSSTGDFSVGDAIVEVKCSSKNFSAADYRQITLYWLLAYVRALEEGNDCWRSGRLINPRRCIAVSFDFGDLLAVIGAGRSFLDLVQVFDGIVTEHHDDASRRG